jgi:transcriptional regulator with XRE-family HTH domain
MRFSGQALCQQRLRANMSRSDLAMAIRQASHGRVKATERGIRGWEKGEYTPRAEAMPSIAAALGCEIIDLYGDGASLEDDEEAAALSLDDYLRVRVRQILREETAALRLEESRS